MDQRQGDLLARVLDMTQIELRAAMLTIVHEAHEENPRTDLLQLLADVIDATYNPIRRTGVKI